MNKEDRQHSSWKGLIVHGGHADVRGRRKIEELNSNFNLVLLEKKQDKEKIESHTKGNYKR